MFHFILKTLTSPNFPKPITILKANNVNIPIVPPTTLCKPSATTLITDYLTGTLGFTPESALHLSTKLRRRKPTISNPTPLHSLFHDYGFTPTHIAQIITTCPSFLLSNPDKTLKPKLDFLARNGISGQRLVAAITVNPRILQRSLDQQIAPCIGFLKTFLGSTSALVSYFELRRGTSVLLKFSDSTSANIETLRQCRVPHDNIVRLMSMQPHLLSRDAEDFGKTIREVEELGFDPKSMMFIHGVCTLSSMRKDKWVSKFEVFKSFGWSEAEFLALFLKQPPVMRTSEARLRRGLEFLLNEMGWGVADVAKYPTVLCLSFEKRVLPRWWILRVLVDKGIIMKRTTVAQSFLLSEGRFVSEFLKGYEQHVPEIVEIYLKTIQGL